MRLPRRIHVDRRAVDEQRAFRGVWPDLVIDRQDVLSGRQHGDHHVRAFHGRRCAGHRRDAVVPRGRKVFRHQVEALHGMPRFDEVRGHGVAHIAEADEGDGGHEAFLRNRE